MLDAAAADAAFRTLDALMSYASVRAIFFIFAIADTPVTPRCCHALMPDYVAFRHATPH